VETDGHFAGRNRRDIAVIDRAKQAVISPCGFDDDAPVATVAVKNTINVLRTAAVQHCVARHYYWTHTVYTLYTTKLSEGVGNTQQTILAGTVAGFVCPRIGTTSVRPTHTAKSSRFETLLMVPKWCFKPLTVVLAPQLVIRGTNYRVTVRNGVRTAALQSLETPLMDSHHRYI